MKEMANCVPLSPPITDHYAQRHRQKYQPLPSIGEESPGSLHCQQSECRRAKTPPTSDETTDPHDETKGETKLVSPSTRQKMTGLVAVGVAAGVAALATGVALLARNLSTERQADNHSDSNSTRSPSNTVRNSLYHIHRPKRASGKHFGVSLHSCPLDGPTGAPAVLQKMVEAVQPYLSTEGIFRVSGDKARYEPVIDLLEQDKPLRDGIEASNDEGNGHVIANVIKMWLRNLPDDDRLLAQVDLSLGSHQTPDAAISFALRCLPPARQATLMQVLKLGCDVANRVSENKMSLESFAVCVAPTLYHDPDISDPTVLATVNLQRVLFHRLLKWYQAQHP